MAGAAPGASVPVAPPPPVQAGGAYAPPGPPGYPAQPGVSGYGGAVPQPVSPGYGAMGGAQAAYPPPPQPVGLGGGLGAPGGPVAFSTGAEAPFPVSPWARAAPSAGLTSQPSSPPANTPGVPPAQPPLASPIPGMGPGAGLGGAMGQQPVAQAPVFGAPPPIVSPPPMVTPGLVAPPPLVQGGAVAPPPLVQGGVPAAVPTGTPGLVAPPPLVQGGAVAPPPLVQGGVPAAVPVRAPAIVAPPVVQGAVSGVVQPVSAQPSRVLVGFIVTFQNDPGGSFWPIYSGRTQVGRAGADPGTEIGLADASASSRHASLHADPTTGQVFIEDDGSRNGTFVNEQRLAQGERRQLRDNDRLRLGSTTFVVKVLVA
ncbi:FHA domain-containing protein [Sorangium sp. So ce854]|uniref:FHA domain-containing protein n=1 Tax=Sorangium sp. So ce854 TaxID=3133322 RepID=UPI003F5F37AB